jgi:isochorismate synthase
MHIKKVLEKKLVFALWSLPGSTAWQGIAEEKSTPLSSLSAQSNGFVVAPYERDDAFKFIEKEILISSIELTDAEADDLFREYTLKKDPGHCVSKADYLLQCNHIINEIKKGKASKVVLSRIKKAQGPVNPILLFQRLLEKYPMAMVFMYSFGEEIWFGASPETLLKIEDDGFSTMALAGSKSIESTRAWSEKEVMEQRYVESYIEDILKKEELHFTKEGPSSIAAGPVLHLQSTYKGKLANSSYLSLLKALHPTPAVCGIPLNAARKIIKDSEKHQRMDYCGYVGPLENGKASLFVNLRSAVYSDQQIYLFLGGGITEDSDPEEEWKETELKAQTLLSIL